MANTTKYLGKIAPGGDAAETVASNDDQPAGTWTKSSAQVNPVNGGRAVSDRSTASSKRFVSFADVSKTLNERSTYRRYGFWVKFWSFVASVVWNVASPIKSYVLSYYGLPGDDLVFSHNLNWTMEVDYQYARALYNMSGVKYTAPEDKPIRFINMYIDFVVFNRASIWAKHLDDFQQDPYIGFFCRASLVPKGAKITNEMAYSCWTRQVPGDGFLESKTCRVNEVSEAIMCLKGINVLQLLNYEWQSTYDPTNPYIQEGAQKYQDALFPNLTACLDRRAYLVEKVGRDDALHQIVQELAANFSLDPIGFAGKKGMYAPYVYTQGFTDLSGTLSGVRYSQMSGSLPQRTQPVEPDLNALMAGRERLWWLAAEKPEVFRDTLLGFAYYAPYWLMSYNLNNKATSSRFVDWYMIRKVGTVGMCQTWEFVPTSNRTYPDPIYLDSQPESSVLSGYMHRYVLPQVIAEKKITDAAEFKAVSSYMTTPCITRDGCMDHCYQVRTGSWTATFNRAGLCQMREVSQSLFNRQGFIDWRCAGEGKGTDIFSVMFAYTILRSDGSNYTYHHIKNIVNPGAIVACVLGGRIPQVEDEPYPNTFFDLIENGPNTIITTTFSRGTEKVLVNVYALVSFVGCAVFSVWVMQNLMRLLRMLQRVKRNALCDRKELTQLLDSVFTLNLSTISHGRNIQLSKVILWLNLVTWYLGASDSNCTWWVGGVDLWSDGFQLNPSDSPYYKCKPGYFIEFLDSFLGVVRLVSISYNFYSLTCQHLILRGATRYVLPFLSPILFFGLLPTFVASTVITAINHIRLTYGVLETLHNQLFLVIMWILFLFGYHWSLQNAFIGRHLVDVLCRLKLCGKQKIKPGSIAEALIGPYYLTMPGFARPEETEWIPLSVALESPTFDMSQLDFAARKYSFTKRIKVDDVEIPTVPQWVLEDDEYFFC